MTSAINSPTLGARILTYIDLEELIPLLNRKALYRISWGAQKAKGSKWEDIQRDFDRRLKEMLDALQEEPWINPKAGYGHWLADSQGNSIRIHDPQQPGKILAEFPLPRQAGRQGMCLADYLPPAANAETAVLSFQIVTVGKRASEHINALFHEGNYVEGYFAHGLAVQFAETTAEYIHQKIRNELGLRKNQGRRYSWGYEPIPDLSQHETLFNLLPAREELGMELTSAFQLIPEQSTAAMVIHHEKARYFNMHD
ncbi:MAG TPA: hypothetical protein DCK95_03570 [Anaerolineaceae bacterium]|nr:hypothetical protein [Anaerolineaceae bacterium]